MRIFELTNKECVEALTHLTLGRLACSRDDQPYIVPVYFAYYQKHLYSVATCGEKINWMRANPQICLETDEIINHCHWLSIIVQGHFEELVDTPEWEMEREMAHELLQRQAMWWEPACLSFTCRGTADELIPIYYRIHIDQMTGRRATPDSIEAVALVESAQSVQRKTRIKNLLRRLGLAGSDDSFY